MKINFSLERILLTIAKIKTQSLEVIPYLVVFALGIAVAVTLNAIASDPYYWSNRYFAASGDTVIFSDRAPAPATVPIGIFQAYETRIKPVGPCGNFQQGIEIEFETYPEVYGNPVCLGLGTYILVYYQGQNILPPQILIVHENWAPKLHPTTFFHWP